MRWVPYVCKSTKNMFMSRNDAFNLIKNSIIIDKKGTL